MKKYKKRLLALILSLALFTQILQPVIAETGEKTQPIQETKGLQNAKSTDEEPYIIGEDTSKREESVKHFRMNDGSMMAAQYDTPVHVKNTANQWENIDNALLEDNVGLSAPGAKSSADEKEFINKKGNSKVKLSDKAKDKNMFSLENEGFRLSWGYAGARKSTVSIADKNVKDVKKAPKQANANNTKTDRKAKNNRFLNLPNLTQETWYRDIYMNVDLQCIISPSGFKENIILKQKDTQNEFIIKYNIGKLSYKQTDDKTILLTDREKKIFTITAPCMQDANGVNSDGVSLSVAGVNHGELSVKLTADKQWLSDKGRAFPVTVDPTIIAKRPDTEMTGKFSTELKTTNTGVTGYLYVGNQQSPVNNNMGKVRSLIKMNGLPDIGSGSAIVNAQMCLYQQSHTSGTPKNQINAYQITGPWSSSVNSVNDQAPYNSSDPIDFVISDTSRDYSQVQWDITKAAREWYSNDATNFGILLKAENENIISISTYVSPGVNGNYLGDGAKPLFVLSYRDTKGLEDYWTYTSMDAQRGVTANVNNYNGNLVVTAPIAGVGGSRMPVSIDMVYNESQQGHVSTAGNNTWCGFGWQTNFHMRITGTPKNPSDPGFNSNYPYYLVDGDGTEHYFCKKTGGASYEFTDEDGLGYTLTDNGSGDSKYVIKTKDSLTIDFNTNGALTKITDSNGNWAYVSYTNGPNGPRINFIRDGVDRRYTFGYTSSDNTLVSITDPGGRVTKLAYWGGYLSKLTYPDGKNTSFTFAKHESGGYGMVRISNPDGSYIGIRQQEGSNGLYTDDAAYTSKYYPQKRLRVKELASYGTSGGHELTYKFNLKQNALDVTTYKMGNLLSVCNNVTYLFNNFGQTTCVIDRITGKAQYYEQGKPREKDAADGRENKTTSVSKAQMCVVNIAANAHFENNLTNYTVYKQNTAATVAIDSGRGNIGKPSVKFAQSASSNAGYLLCSQDIVALNGTYTFSGYLNTGGNTLTGGAGGCLFAEVFNSGGTKVRSAYSEGIKLTEENEWKRVQLTVQVYSGERLRLSAGYVDGTLGSLWADDLQLENGQVMNHHNMLYNSDISQYLQGWYSNTDMSIAVDSRLGVNDRGAAINGSTSGTREIYQYVAVNGQKGDAFSFGGWCRLDNGSAPSTIPEGYQRVAGCDTYAVVRLAFYNADGTRQFVLLNLNSYISDWQFLAGQAIAEKPYVGVAASLVYGYNIGRATLAMPYLYKEDFGQSYQYDKNGNVISASDLNKQESTFSYTSNNDLAKLVNPDGSRFYYSSNYKHNMESSHSLSGQRYTFGYDESGNGTSAKVVGEKPATTIEAGKIYYIRNMATGMDIDSNRDVPGYNACHYRYIANEPNQKWYMSNAAGYASNEFTLRRSATTSLAMQESGSYIRMETFGGYASNRFWTEPYGDGSFRIKASSGRYLDGTAEGTYVTTQSLTTKENQRWYFYEYKTEAQIEASGYIQTNADYASKYDYNYLTTLTNNRGKQTQYAYNKDKGLLSSVTDSKGSTTNYAYDELDRVQKVTSGSSSNEYEYDACDRLSTIWHNAKSVKYSFLYNQFGRNSDVRVGNSGGSNRTLASYTYTGRGLLDTMTYGTGQTVRTLYDGFDRIMGKQYNGVTANRYTYNADGQVGIYQDYVANTRMQNVYDLSGRLASSKTAAGADTVMNNDQTAGTRSGVWYTYDDKSRVSNTRTVFEEGAFTYNASVRYGTAAKGTADRVEGLRLTSLSPAADILSYEYDALGRRTRRTINGAAPYITDYTYETVSGNRTSTTVKTVKNGNDTLTYEYDDNGNIIRILKNNAETDRYTYDNLNQLTWEYSTAQGKAFNYAYDNGGNLLSKKTYAYTNGAVGAQVGSTVSYGYTDSIWKDLMTSWNGQSITYDAIGNPLTYRDGMTMSWSKGRQLDKITKNGSALASFTYDANGVRTSKTANGVTHTYYNIGGQMLHEAFGDTRLSYLTDESGKYYAIRKGTKSNPGTGEYYGLFFNAQGDVIGLVNQSGAVVSRYTYDAWGNPLSVTDANGDAITDMNHIANLNPIRYRGYYWDSETKLYSLPTRCYDPTTGRFLNADAFVSTGQGLLSTNMFAYCNNNPVNNYDSLGAWAFSIGCEFNFSIGIGKYSISLSFSAGVSFDDKGNFDAYYSNGKGTANGALTFFNSIIAFTPDAENIYELSTIDGLPYKYDGNYFGIGTGIGLDTIDHGDLRTYIFQTGPGIGLGFFSQDIFRTYTNEATQHKPTPAVSKATVTNTVKKTNQTSKVINLPLTQQPTVTNLICRPNNQAIWC